MAALEQLRQAETELTEWRRHIHRHPELAFKEQATASFVAEKLRSWGLEVETGIATTGVVATLRRGSSARSIGLRADLDALPMQEGNHFEHRSIKPGCFHGCGHDGHTVMLLGAARYLAQHGRFDGAVHFIFQPAEEGQGGGEVMVNDGLFERFPCDEVYALHNWPGLPRGQLGVLTGPVMAYADLWDLHVSGKGSHAAFPEQGVDPIYIATQLVQAWQGLVSRTTAATSPAVISVTRFHAGTAHNVIPEHALLGGTLRSLEPETRTRLMSEMQRVASAVAGAWGGTAQLDFKEGYPGTINDARCAAFAAQAAERVFPKEAIQTTLAPSMGGEDFSYMLQKRPGAYLWLGQGSQSHSAGLHNPHYDFDDSLLPLGASLHVCLAEARLAGE